jgi:hypothetical protein
VTPERDPGLEVHPVEARLSRTTVGWSASWCALERLVRESELGRRLGRAARALVLERFDIRASGQRLVQLFGQVSDHARREGVAAPGMRRSAHRAAPAGGPPRVTIHPGLPGLPIAEIRI